MEMELLTLHILRKTYANDMAMGKAVITENLEDEKGNILNRKPQQHHHCFYDNETTNLMLSKKITGKCSL
ncbi:Hypothetical predicted protein [Octopus vulgaris]|uniref:Uncharacterized protein n=1 Tax=Octopus vulgaris TaxID=6645 RepID=A0AA36B1J8_OCTVU|nr:Hypothetical predicted protein [Octopus vulgaris]